MIRALAMISLAACASAPPEHLPEIARAPRPLDAAPPDSAPRACLPDLVGPTVALLTADGPAIHVCFSKSVCFAIDRHTSAIERVEPQPIKSVPSGAARELTISANATTHLVDACVEHTCTTVTDAVIDPTWRPLTGAWDEDIDQLLTAFTTTGPNPHLQIRVLRGKFGFFDLDVGGIGRCASAFWVRDDVVVATDDCDGGSPATFFFTAHQDHYSRVAGPSIDMRDAFTADREGDAIVAPRAYALVLVDKPFSVSAVVDLVPIQAAATDSPAFGATPLASGDWLVASASGGVGIVDRTTARIAHTWIIPRCSADDPATGP